MLFCEKSPMKKSTPDSERSFHRGFRGGIRALWDWARFGLLTLVLVVGSMDALMARPERIVPGDSYYSLDYSAKDGIAELGAPRNFEEVYQMYTYYEGVYDAKQRISHIRAYERGQVIWEERYFYDAEGKATHKERIEGGGVAKRIPLASQ